MKFGPTDSKKLGSQIVRFVRVLDVEDVGFADARLQRRVNGGFIALLLD